MKIIIDKSVIAYATKSTINVLNDTADALHKNIGTDRLKKTMDFSNKEINRKWGSVSVVDGVVTVDIKDEFIIDVIRAYESVCSKFAPIIGVFYSMRPMFKNYIKDAKNIFSGISEKYAAEYEYTVKNIIFPGVETGYIIFYRVKGDTKWITCITDISLKDEFLNMGRKVHDTMINHINEVTTDIINSENPGDTSPVFNSIDDAEAYLKSKLQHQDIDEVMNVINTEVKPWDAPLDTDDKANLHNDDHAANTAELDRIGKGLDDLMDDLMKDCESV